MKYILQSVVVLALVCGSLASRAQSAGQAFTGRVTDPSGAVLPGVQITVLNLASDEKRSTVTTATGDYSVSYLIPGVYSVSAEKAGFTKVRKSNITLSTDQTGTISFSLPIGSVQETVVVEAGAVLLDSAKADLGTVIDEERVAELPLNGRNPLMLFNLAPGTVSMVNPQWQRPFDNVNQAIIINAGNNQVNLDGSTNDLGGVNGYVPTVDSVKEMKIVTNSYDAQGGHGSGGVIDVTLKSGTNKMHGDVYEYYRRTWLDANSFQNNYYARPRSEHWQDQYGFELDGPIRVPRLYDGRNKVFYLFQFENYREGAPSIQGNVDSVPNPNWVKGDFSDLQYWDGTRLLAKKLYDPSTPLHLETDADGVAKLQHDAFRNNQIPIGVMNPIALRYMALFPAPNQATPTGYAPYQQNYYYRPTEIDTYHNGIAKLDFNIGGNNQVDLRWAVMQRFISGSGNGLPTTNIANHDSVGWQPKGQDFGLSVVHTFTSSTIAEFKATVMTYSNGASWGPKVKPSSLGFASYLDSYPKLPNMGASNYKGLGGSVGFANVYHALAMNPNVMMTRRQHSIRAGVDMRFFQSAYPSNWDGFGFNFDTGWTKRFPMSSEANNVQSGDSIASMLLGAASGGYYYSNPKPFFSQHYAALWLQDDWKVTPRLTLNLGMRYDLDFPITERHNKMIYAFDGQAANPVSSLVNRAALPIGASIIGGETYTGVNGNPRAAYGLELNLLQPRVGFAFQLDSKTVVRGGIGESFNNTSPAGGTDGFSSSNSYVNSLNGGINPTTNLANPFPAGLTKPLGSSQGLTTNLGNGFSFVNPNFRIPSYWSYSFGFERELTRHDVIEINYVGSRSPNQPSSSNINQINPAFYAQCDVMRGGNHQICDNQTFSNGKTNPQYQVTNPFYQVAGFNGGYYSNQTISPANLTRPYVAFQDINEQNLNEGKTTYNSLQTTADHKLDHNLSLHATWTWTKAIESGKWLDQMNGVRYRSLWWLDAPHKIAVSAVWNLPVGRGHKLLPNINRLVDGFVGGWELSPLFVFQTGGEWNPGSNWEYHGNPAMSIRTLSSTGLGYERIRGVSPCVGRRDIDTGNVVLGPAAIANGCTNAILVQRSNYQPQVNTVDTGIRNPNSQQFDTSFSKNFTLTESSKVQIRMDAFNALNHQNWGGYSGDPNDSNFGTITKGPGWGPNNLPRYIQLSAKLRW